jgi:hypothetical protein
MNRARDRREGTPAYEEWKASRQLEIEEEQNRELVLSGVLSDEYLSGFGTIVRQPFSEAQVDTAMAQFMAETADYVKTKANAKVLIEFLYRNNISPAACSSYRIGHAILKLWALYPDEVVPQTAPVPQMVEEPQQVLTPSEKFMADQVNLDTVFAIVDGVEISERYLNSLPSREELKIRRKLEKGHAGDSNLDEYLERRDVKFAMEQEVARKGAEESQ